MGSPYVQNNNWQFAGPQVGVTIAAGQHLSASASAGLGTTALPAGYLGFDIGLCYQLQGTGPIVNFNGGNYMTVVIRSANETLPYSVSATATPPAGTYLVGFCLREQTANESLNYNDWVNGWVMVSN